jgi:hypothetical protein
VPTFGRTEPDFEPLPEGSVPLCELACTAEPEPAAEHEEALVRGVMRESAVKEVLPRRPVRGDPVDARVVVRALAWPWTDTCEQVFLRLGALTARAAMRRVVQDRERPLIETGVRQFF